MSGWWSGTRDEFLKQTPQDITGALARVATHDGWQIESAQTEEWTRSVTLLQEQVFDKPLTILKAALSSEHLSSIHGVVFEYDFKRRGLRIDALLLVGSHCLVVEFKRGKLTNADTEQVVNYCVNLCEFHEVTQDSIKNHAGKVIPILVSREDKKIKTMIGDTQSTYEDWSAIPKCTTRCFGGNLKIALQSILEQLPETKKVDVKVWDQSIFKPSSTIIDAALSLYGNHNVSAIKEHASEMQVIQSCIDEIKKTVKLTRESDGKSLIFMSGAPGAGKTLVGLDIVFSKDFRDEAVFLTGNAPLVEVLKASLKKSYKSMARSRVQSLTGYSKKGVRFIEKNTVFKIVKAHHFLKFDKNQEQKDSTDGDILVIDEAQRTYEKGRMVIDHKLKDHEANLIIEQMQRTRDKPVIILLIGHNQHINKGERGATAWLEAAEKYEWSVYISDETLKLSEFESIREQWSSTKHKLRKTLEFGHLQDSIRYYRNKSVERWADGVLTENPQKSLNEAILLEEQKNTIWVTRDLSKARDWVRSYRIGEERAGLIASGKGGRLQAEGVFPSMKPDIAKWMLSPTEDIRSSNMLETAQNQFQIQGLELDYTIVCWDADLRVEEEKWSCYNISGAGWTKSKQASALQERKNGYRVLLTRARKGMIIFVPRGDISVPTIDKTRKPEFYDSIYDYLVLCGAKPLTEANNF